MNNKRIAEIILIISFLCFCVTHYFAGNNFVVDILHAGFAAALVGGLADWFAITAFFQKVFIFPHTDIIREESDQLIQSIADFFTDDVLNKENIKNKLYSDDINMSQLLIEYLTKFQGREKIVKISRLVVRKFLESLDLQTIVKNLEPDMRQFLKKNSAEKLIPKIISKIISSRHTVNFYRVLLGLVKSILEQPIFGRIISENITSMMERYDMRGTGRKTLRSKTFSNDKILNLIIEQGQNKIDIMIASPDDSYSKIKEKIESLVNSQAFFEMVNEEKNILLDETNIKDWIYKNLDNYRRKNIAEILNECEKLVNWLIDSFCSNKDWQKKFNDITKKKANELIAENHEQIRQKIKEALHSKSKDELVKMVQDSAGDSAHAIRISGSLVGGMAGMILYAVAIFVEGMMK